MAAGTTRSSARAALRRSAVELARGAVFTLLRPWERSLVARAGALETPPVFVIGAPRSGTTLLFESLVRRMRLAYVTNLSDRFHRVPVAVTRLGRRTIEGWKGAFESRYGHIDGWGAPSEGGRVWGRWIPEEHSLGRDHAASVDGVGLRGTIAGLSEALEAPFVSKNVMHGVHIPLLDTLFPGCLFLEIRRDVAANARSIVSARVAGARDGREDDWFSVRPRGWQAFRACDPAEQAVAQILLLRDEVAEEFGRLGPARHLSVEYETLAHQPRVELDRVEAFLETAGLAVQRRAEIPAAFETRRPTSRDSALDARIEAALQSHAGSRPPGAARLGL